MDKTFLIAIACFILMVLLGLLAIYYTDLLVKKKGLRERIRSIVADRKQDAIGPRLVGRILSSANRLGEALKPKLEGDVSRTRMRLMRAGHQDENDPAVLFGAKIVLALLLPMLIVVLKLAALHAMPVRQFLALALSAAAGGFFLPELYLYRKAKERQRRIFEGFPEALDLMVVCVEAGMGLDGAIKRVGDEMALKNKQLSDEFRILSLELRAGKPRAEALRSLAARTDLEDVSGLVTLLIQTDRFGTRVAQALRVHADSMRTKRYMRAEELAAKIPIKILFPLVLFILPALLITLLGPVIIKFYRVVMQGGVL
jgi:tight adherence protein C